MNITLKKINIEPLDFLVSLYTFCVVTAELMGGKTFPLAKVFGYQLNASVAIFLLPLIFTINDMITEVYGKQRARSVIRSALGILVLLILFSLLAMQLPPSARFAPSEAAYDTIFAVSTRISAASLVAFALAEFLDVLIFSKIREKLGKKALWLRNNVSNIIAQFIDTSVFMTLAFYAFEKPINDNAVFLVSLIIPYWLLKCSMSVIGTPLVYAGVQWLRTGAQHDSK